MPILTALLALVLQDDPAARVRELSRAFEASETRSVYRGIEAIAGLGTGALPALEELARDAKPRVRAYLELAAAEIRSGPAEAAPRMTIQRTDSSALTLLEEIQRKSGYPMSLRELAQEEKLPNIPVDIRDATLLEAVDAVCRAGNVSFYQEDGVPLLYAGDYEDYPKFFFGNYMFLLETASYGKSVDFRKPVVETYAFGLGLLWDHRVEPATLHPAVEVLEAVDDQGHDLLLPADRPKPEGDEETVVHSFSLDSSTTLEALQIKPPGLGVERIARLRGRVKLSFPKKSARVVFEKPAVGDRKTVDGFEVEIVTLQPGGPSAELRIRSSARKPAEIERMPLMATLELRGAGKLRALASSSAGEDAVTAEIYANHATFQLDGPREEREKKELRVLELRIVTETADRHVPFEFRDVKIK